MSSLRLILLISVTGCLSVPRDMPVRVDLPVFDDPEPSNTNTKLAEPLESENHPGVDARSDKSLVANLISQKLQASAGVLGSKLGGHHEIGGGIFSPSATHGHAVLETEGWGSKTLSIKENIQHIVAGLFQPKPIVDTITEDEKYGNDGDKFYHSGRAIVGGAEGVSNLVNTVLEVPGNIFRKITRAATEKLNHLGGRLVGLN